MFFPPGTADSQLALPDCEELNGVEQFCKNCETELHSSERCVIQDMPSLSFFTPLEPNYWQLAILAFRFAFSRLHSSGLLRTYVLGVLTHTRRTSQNLASHGGIIFMQGDGFAVPLHPLRHSQLKMWEKRSQKNELTFHRIARGL